MQQKDHDILESLHQAAPMMRNMASRYAYDYSDLYQVAAEATLLYYDRAQQTLNPRAYLHRAIRNTVLKYVGAVRIKRKQTLSDHYLITSLDAPLPHDDAFLLQDIVAAQSGETEQERDFSRLYVCLESLPAIYREVICMRFGISGYGVHRPYEIARILGISPSAVDSRLRKAKEMLRQYSELIEMVERESSQ